MGLCERDESWPETHLGGCMHYLVLLLQEGEFFFLCSICNSQHVAKRHVFKALWLSDVIIYTPRHGNRKVLNLNQLRCCTWHTYLSVRTVGDVDASWYSTPSEGENIQRGEVRFKESVLLKLPGPRQLGEQDLCWAHQFTKTLTHRLVHNRNKTWRRQHNPNIRIELKTRNTKVQ